LLAELVLDSESGNLVYSVYHNGSGRCIPYEQKKSSVIYPIIPWYTL